MKHDQKRILTVNISFKDNQLWSQKSGYITDYDKIWNKRSLLFQIIKVLEVARGFEVILLHYDVKFAFIISLLARILPGGRLKKVVFVTLLVDVSRYKKRNLKTIIHWLFYYLFIRIPNKILVHTSYEVKVYKEVFRDRKKSRIKQINYFSYNNFSNPYKKKKKSEYIVCAGNHRDIGTFVNAAKKLNRIKSIVIAGEGDRKDWEGYKHKKIEILFNQPYGKYQDIISGATALIIPIKKNYPIRSLGLIAAFEGIYLKVPIIASDTFHLKDYFNSNEIYYFFSENVDSLSSTIDFVISDSKDVISKTRNAFEKTKIKYNKDVFLNKLYSICIE